jgi:hypothetical protein
MLLKLDVKVSFHLRKTIPFYDQSLKYLEKWFDFSDLYKLQLLLLKKDSTYSDFKKAAVVSNLKMSVNLDELYVEFCIIKPTLALFLNDKSKKTPSVSDKWCQIVLAADSGLPDVACILLFVLYSCAQRLYGTSFLNYGLLQEKLMQ